MEAMIPQRPGGEDRVGVEPSRCSSNEGFLFCPPVLFPTAMVKHQLKPDFFLPFCAFFLCDEEGGFARRFFMENFMVIVNMFVA